MVQELKGKGCHLIVCLSHLGYRYSGDKVSDQHLAREVEGIDLILGGHTHTFMEQPQALLQAHGHETLIHQVGWAGMRLGRIDYVFEKSKKKILQDSASIAIESLPSKIWFFSLVFFYDFCLPCFAKDMLWVLVYPKIKSKYSQSIT